LFNLNFNHSFNQIPIFLNQSQLKIFFIKQFFSNYNYNNYRNTKQRPPPLSTNFGVVSDYQAIEFGYLLGGDKSNKALVFARA
jgi:hypothetical protein